MYFIFTEEETNNVVLYNITIYVTNDFDYVIFISENLNDCVR